MAQHAGQRVASGRRRAGADARRGRRIARAASRRAGARLPAMPAHAGAASGAMGAGRSRARPAVPWLPVAFGFGIVALFHRRARAGAVGGGGCALAGLSIVAVALRRARRRLSRSRSAVAAIGARLCGRDAARPRASRIRCCERRPASATLAGFVESARGARAHRPHRVRVHAIDGAAPRREAANACASSVRKGTAPRGRQLRRAEGAAVAAARAAAAGRLRFRARPVFPAHRRLRLRRSARSRPTTPPASRRTCGCAMPRRRSKHARRRSTTASARSLPGDAGAIASALITGKRDAISTPVNDAMYVSGLGHVLSISGYHMAVVAGHRVLRRCARAGAVPALARRAARSRNGRPPRRWSRRRSICCCRAPRSRPSARSS